MKCQHGAAWDDPVESPLNLSFAIKELSMKQVLSAVLIIMCGVALVGCKGKSDSENDIPKAESNIAEPNELPPSERPPISNADTFELQGTVVHKNIEGGFYAIDGDDGKKYNPVNLSESFRKDGLKVKVTARLRMDAMSIHMYGAIIEVVEIAGK
jgi:hypothetical protein